MMRLLFILLMLPSLCLAGSGGVFPCTGGWVYSLGGTCTGIGIIGNNNTSHDTTGSTRALAWKRTATTDICVSKAFIYDANEESGRVAKVCVWADDGGSPGAIMYCAAEVTFGSTTAEFLEGAFATTFQISSGTDYWLGYITEYGSANMRYYSDATTGSTYYYNDSYNDYPNPPDPYTGVQSGTTTKNIQIYLEN